MLTSVNPYTQQTLHRYRTDSAAAIERKLNRADRAFGVWSALPITERIAYLQAVGRYLETQKAELGALITAEMGKTLKEAVAEVEKCALTCSFYAEHAEAFLADRPIRVEKGKPYVAYQPLGAVLAVMPWNFPFWQAMRFAIPGLIAGNVGLLKHASNVSGCALAIETAFRESGLPVGVFQTLLVESKHIKNILTDSRVKAVTLTGSEKAGASVAEIAGSQIKKAVLELGGSDALIVLADADLDAAAQTAVQSRMQNAGQSCIAAKRFIVEKSVRKAFTDRVLHHVQAIRQGDPTDAQTSMGPVARLDLAEAIFKQYRQSITKGARTLTPAATADGCNVPPLLLDRVKPGMAAFDEETFGPLAVICEARDEAEAIQLANQSRYGLGSAIWSKDVEKANRLAREIEAGSVFINGLMRSDPHVPFGGIKLSGYGRELSEEGIREFVNVKTVWVS